MARGYWRTTSLLAIAALVCLTSGCAYMKNRGNDLLDVVDVGITANGDPEPDLVVFAHVVPLASAGAGTLQGGMFGIGGRNAGVMAIRQNCYGAVVWGMESIGIAKTDDAAAAQAQPTGNGLIRIVVEPEDSPPWTQWLDCEASLHLGWIGLHARVKPVQMADFLVGLLTDMDIAADDEYPSAVAVKEVSAGSASSAAPAPAK